MIFIYKLIYMDYKEKYIKYKKKYINLKNTICKKQVGCGIADSYCYICGAPFRSFNEGGAIFNFDKTHKKYFDIIKKEEPNIFSNLTNDSYEKDSFIKELEKSKVLSTEIIKKISDKVVELKDKKYNWLNDLVLLHITGKIIKVKDTGQGQDEYWDSSGNKYKGMITSQIDYNIPMHNDCYKLIKSKKGEFTKFNISKPYKNIMVYNDKINEKVFSHQTQVYSWFNYFYDNIEYILESPLNNSKNKNRILKIKNFFNKEISLDLINWYNKNYNKDFFIKYLKEINMSPKDFIKWFNNYVENYNNK